MANQLECSKKSIAQKPAKIYLSSWKHLHPSSQIDQKNLILEWATQRFF